MESTTTFYDIPEDKEYLAFESALAMFDIEMKECEMLLEMADRKREINEKKSEIKVYEEAGTYEDLEMLYTEAENENAQDKSGIIATIGQKIQNAINAIINFFKNIFGKKVEDPDTVVVDPYSPTENENNKKFINSIPVIGGIVAAVAAGTMAVAVAKGKFEETKKNNSTEVKDGEVHNNTKKIDLLNMWKIVPDGISKATKLVTDCMNGFNKAKNPEEKGFFEEVMKYVQNGVARIGDIGKKVATTIGAVVKSNNSPADQSKTTEEPENKELDLSGLSDKMGGKSAATANPDNKGKALTKEGDKVVKASAEIDVEGDEFVETALDRILEEISELR